MDWNEASTDRRRHPRYYPDESHQPEVTVFLNGSPKICITTINISKGGLMGYASSIEHFLGMNDQNINQIVVKFPGKKPFRCTGKILRLQPCIEENICYCAVEFDTVQINHVSETETSAENLFKIKPHSGSDEKLLKRIEQIEKCPLIEDADEEHKIRLGVYNSFDDVTQNLTVDEKWLFYELLDEIIDAAPHFPDRLKNAFLTLCQIGSQKTVQVFKS